MFEGLFIFRFSKFEIGYFSKTPYNLSYCIFTHKFLNFPNKKFALHSVPQNYEAFPTSTQKLAIFRALLIHFWKTNPEVDYRSNMLFDNLIIVDE